MAINRYEMMQLLYKIDRLTVLKIFLVLPYVLSGCGMQQGTNESFDVTNLLTAFPACFSMQASLHFIDARDAFRSRLVCCIRYNKQIDFIVKGPLGIAFMRGSIGTKGVTIVDHLHRVVHQLNYEQIKEKYHFSCNYLLIQSLLLGTVADAIAHDLSTPDVLSPDLVYTYDDLTGKIITVEGGNTKQSNLVKVLYQYKIRDNLTYLSGIQTKFSLSDKTSTYKGKAILHKLRFKALKKPNIKLRIPCYARRTFGAQ